jgi:exonuclease SbcC
MEAATARSAAEQQAASAARSAAAALEDSSVAAERAEEAATELAGLLGDVALHAQLARRAETIEEARAEIARLRTAEHAAARLHAEAVAARAEHTAAEQSLVASLVAASARVRPSAPPPDMEDLVAAREEIATLVGEQREEAAAAQSRAVAAASRLAEQRTELIAALGLEPGADLAAAARRASEEVAALEAEVSLLDDRLARHEELERQNAATVQRRETYARLADDLLPSRFLAFLLDEERAQLSELGSERFELLSGGRYRFAGDGSFDVVDLNAAERQRSATSLSGGETFLASLALALALADMVARQGGLIDAFFLDEGFGSLDGEHLDLAMEGIERLVAAASGRLVVVVSHVAELRQRIEDLIVLDKDPLTGDSRVLES